MKWATPIWSARSRPTGRVSKPIAMSSPPKNSSTPASPIRENRSAVAPGCPPKPPNHPKSFCPPCCRKSNPAPTRRITCAAGPNAEKTPDRASTVRSVPGSDRTDRDEAAIPSSLLAHSARYRDVTVNALPTQQQTTASTSRSTRPNLRRLAPRRCRFHLGEDIGDRTLRQHALQGALRGTRRRPQRLLDVAPD